MFPDKYLWLDTQLDFNTFFVKWKGQFLLKKKKILLCWSTYGMNDELIDNAISSSVTINKDLILRMVVHDEDTMTRVALNLLL